MTAELHLVKPAESSSEEETRVCKTCGEAKAIDQFQFFAHVRKDGTRGRSRLCDPCRYAKYYPTRLPRAERLKQIRANKDVEVEGLVEKRCATCNEVKPLVEFYKVKNRYKSWHPHCNDCRLSLARKDASDRSAANPKYVMFKAAKLRAKQIGVPFALTYDDIVIPEFCPALGIKLERAHGKASNKDSSPSLDRLIPSIGYVVGNVEVISALANRIKTDANSVQVRHVAEWMDRRGL